MNDSEEGAALEDIAESLASIARSLERLADAHTPPQPRTEWRDKS